ncbi:hypothetical protein ACFQV4_29290 [Streptomyces thermocarboxydus]
MTGSARTRPTTSRRSSWPARTAPTRSPWRTRPTRGGIPDEEIDAIVEDNLDRHGGDGLTRLARAAERRLADARRAGVDGTGTARLDDLARAARALAELHDAEQLPFYFDDDRPNTPWPCARRTGRASVPGSGQGRRGGAPPRGPVVLPRVQQAAGSRHTKSTPRCCRTVRPRSPTR